MESNFILVNVPQTIQQAAKLIESRVIPDRVLIITTNDLENISIDDNPIDLLSLKRIFKHNARVLSIPFESSSSSNDENKDSSNTDSSTFEISSKLETQLINAITTSRKRLFHKSPEVPPRIVILGPPSIGKTKLALYISQVLGCEYIHPAHILSTNIKLHTKLGILASKQLGLSPQDETQHTATAISKIANHVSNDLLASMIANDIATDKHVLKHGFILESFPRNPIQAELLYKYGVKPNRIIVIDANTETVVYVNVVYVHVPSTPYKIIMHVVFVMSLEKKVRNQSMDSFGIMWKLLA